MARGLGPRVRPSRWVESAVQMRHIDDPSENEVLGAAGAIAHHLAALDPLHQGEQHGWLLQREEGARWRKTQRDEAAAGEASSLASMESSREPERPRTVSASEVLWSQRLDEERFRFRPLNLTMLGELSRTNGVHSPCFDFGEVTYGPHETPRETPRDPTR